MRIFPSLVISAMLGLSGCATQVPLEIRQPPPVDLNVVQVRDAVDRHAGSRIRWGGVIAAVESRNQETWLEIVAMPLDERGRPRLEDRSPGRFIARVPGFPDPRTFAADRSVTVFGEVESHVVRPIGDHPYSYPLIRTLSYQVWPDDYPHRYAHGPRPWVFFGYHHGFRRGTHFGFGLHQILW